MEPTSSLKYVNSHFYLLYNDLFYNKIISVFGEDIIGILVKILPWLKPYIKSLDTFRYDARMVVASRLGLVDNGVSEVGNPLNCMFVKDSWKYVYSVLKNKRLYAEYSDYRIDEPSNYVYNHFVEINRTYLLSYSKAIWLPPGNYNLNIGLAVKHGSGLGTTKFEIKYANEDGKVVVQTFYPPTNINEILPKNQFCFLKIGEFKVPPIQPKRADLEGRVQLLPKLRKVQLTMEEIGLYLKSGFSIYFIDISQPTLLYNDYDLMYYTVKETNYKYFVNILLKNLYKALNFVQNGGCPDDPNIQCVPNYYGGGDPFVISNRYHKLQDCTGDSELSQDSVSLPGTFSGYDEKLLMKYADFYYNSKFKKRYFKFTTIYQRRQFINRFGDFEMDWNDSNEEEGDSKSPEALTHVRRCSYDKEGLKWKIPIVGEL
ncbi:uncharacterized protein SPAPADRAFT_63421 [Spathaspora passalidarum NRRL Y-27907]|uniref:Uncharacterized protein n=1 Tax=Spathaspora passalidarum (strain NRRL Y-27907 / 11-Y1) TaxID=619300 RepID=G3AUM7_SPAPN|nr:uncharacterized protein SPAPADRAFT_63421 [Spathaspora passalidarum NRRL Y-27907]EGW30583.1 hypothetical protein SPAPADRAFT_63421 [Spathaspora passalidarum NRRL Y-27907]